MPIDTGGVPDCLRKQISAVHGSGERLEATPVQHWDLSIGRSAEEAVVEFTRSALISEGEGLSLGCV
jgi:hypothetical protein